MIIHKGRCPACGNESTFEQLDEKATIDEDGTMFIICPHCDSDFYYNIPNKCGNMAYWDWVKEGTEDAPAEESE